MRAITLRQPWAQQVFDLHNPKNIENRSRLKPPPELLKNDPIDHPFFAIHAGKAYAKDAASLYPVGVAPLGRDECTFGAVLGVVRVVQVVDIATNRHPLDHLPLLSDWSWWLGPIGWVLADPITIDPVKAPGALGCWRLDSLLSREVLKRARATVKAHLMAQGILTPEACQRLKRADMDLEAAYDQTLTAGKW